MMRPIASPTSNLRPQHVYKMFDQNRKCILCFSEECRCRSNQKPAPTGIITQMNPYLWTSTTVEVAGVSALRGFGSPILLMSGGAVIYGRVLEESCFRTIDLLKVAEITQSQQALKIARHPQNYLPDTDENRPSKGEAAEGVENESYNVCLSKNVFETMMIVHWQLGMVLCGAVELCRGQGLA